MTLDRPCIKDNLHREFLRRKEQNPRYSLRAFARDLQISPTALSMAMADKRSLSPKNAEKIIKKLGLLNGAPGNFNLCDVITKRKLTERKVLEEKEFSPISDWYYLALLNLVKIGECPDDVFWISKRLEIPLDAARGALMHLKNLGYLKQHRGRLLRTVRPLDSSSEISSQSIKSYHKQVLGLATDSIEKVSLDLREFSSVTFPLDVSKISAAKNLIRKFRDEMGALLGEGAPSEVYCFSLQLFPLSKGVK